MKRTWMVRKPWIVTTLILALVLSVAFGAIVLAEDELIKWIKLDAMDINFDVIENKAGDQDVLIALDVEDAGTYELYYYLEDGRQTYIQFTQGYDDLEIEFHVRENDGTGGYTDVTQALALLSYLEMDYELTVPDWIYESDKEVGLSGGLEYNVPRSASNKYPGVAFEVNNKKVLIKWDFQSDLLYMVIDDYENGKIMPITFTTPNKGSETIKVLKQLEDFDVLPTHYITTDGAINIQVSPLEQPNESNQKPGNKPGLDVTFKQPKEMNLITWQYDYELTDMDDITAVFELDDIGSDAYFDFNMKLQNDSDQVITNIDVEADGVNDNVAYVYNPATYEYTVHIVQDKSELVDQATFVQWSELGASRLYDVAMGFQIELTSNTFDNYGFDIYAPENKFAATYMSFELTRSNVEEAYLDVTPYNAGESEEIEYTILYSKVIKETLDSDEDLWLKNYHTSNDDNDEIFIPVPFKSTSSQDAYQIIVSFSGTDVYSQVLNYRAIDDVDVPPTTPDIEIIENLFVVPPLTDDTTDPEKVQFDVAWSAPANKEVPELDTIFEDLNPLEEDRLFYELSVNDVPTDGSSNPFQIVKVFEVTKVDGEYRIGLYAPTPGDEYGSDTVNFISGYNEINELFRMDSIVLRDDSTWTNILTTVIDDDNDTYTITDSGVEADFEFPGVNYVRLKAISIKDGELSTSALSIAESISLSLNAYDIPIVDTLVYEPLYGVEEERTSGITLEWDAVNTNNYETYMLAPISKEIQSLVYTVYIAENKENILPLAEDDLMYYEVLPKNNYQLAISDDGINYLRNDEVIYFDMTDDGGEDYLVDIEGLDVNRDYNIRIVTKLVINDQVLGSAEDETRRSEGSSILSVTVPKAPGEPSDEEIAPLAPETFTVNYADESEINALLRWHMPDEMIFENNQNGFEILGIEDRHLPESLEGTTFTLREVLEDYLLEDDVVEGWRLYVHEGVTVFEKYDPKTGKYVEKDQSLISREDNYFTLIDDANAPNKVNYYYVRTVKMQEEVSKTVSPWVAATLTTAPVKGPINLTIDYTTPYTYNNKEEIIVRFDAPVPDINKIGTDYIMEVHVKGEGDTDYSTTDYPAAYMGTDEADDPGYLRLYYRISDLTPGKTYNFKVRIQDRTKPMEILPDDTEDFPKSPFSDIVITRIEFDQEAYDKEKKYEEYLEYYLTKAEALKELLYFTVKDTEDTMAIKYRENYSEGLIMLNSSGELALYSGDRSVNTYYLPSNTINLVNDQNVTLIIESRDQIVGLRPDTIGIRITDEVTAMIHDIDSYASENEDWYLRIRVYTDEYNGTINTSKPSGLLVEVDFAVVGSSILEEDMDEGMVNQLDTVIAANKNEVIEAIEAELENGINEAELLKVVEAVVDEVEKEYVGQASIYFNRHLDTIATSVNDLNKSVYIALKPEDDSGNHAIMTKLNGNWRQETSNFFNERYYVETVSSNSFIPVASNDLQGELVSIYGQMAVDVINAYDLTTIFSAFDLADEDELLDKYQWHSALARLVGAKAGQDNVVYLKALEIYGSETNLYGTLTYDEALMTYVQAYAYRHLIQLEHVNIMHHRMIEDIDQVAEPYKLDLLRAANLSIIETEGGYLYPNHSITMKEALTLLTTLHKGID